MPAPLCFVLMPFGRKSDGSGLVVDFDAVYATLIAPAVGEAGLEVLRADEEKVGGIIHRAMFERLILCDYAVADLTTANANVFYELGVRHAARPWSTVAVFAKDSRLPFDVSPLRGIPYALGKGGVPARPAEARAPLVQALREARKAQQDSPVFTLIEGMRPQAIDHAKTDSFRDRVRYSQDRKAELAVARTSGAGAVRAVAGKLGEIADAESGVVVDLLLSFRAVEAWKEMIDLAGQMSEPMRRTVMVREQLAFALNRSGRGEEAERVLLEVLGDHGPSSETYGLLGRVYKDRWEAAVREGREALAAGLLDKAIRAYLSGFEADWRDPYPGINALTLMELATQRDPRQPRLLPVVEYALERKMTAGEADYWDHATRLELAVLARDQASATQWLGRALAAVRERWEPKTTARNLRLLREARGRRGEEIVWAAGIEAELLRAAGDQ